jgi:hypothetical protein
MTTTNVPDGVGTADDLFDSLLADAVLPYQSVRLCLNGKLRREYEEVKARIDERAAQRDAAATAAAAEAAGLKDVRLGTKIPEPAAPGAGERDPEQDRLDELAARVRAESAEIVVQAKPSSEYNKLLQAHPPRKDPATGRIDQRDYAGYNSSTFPAELVRASIVKPQMTPERWARLDAALTDIQFDRLFNACAEVNRKDEDVPFSPSDSEPTPG